MAFQVTGPTSVQRITAPDPPPDRVTTRFAGELTFRGGIPTEETLQGIYDQLDFQRGCQVFLRHIMAGRCGGSSWRFGATWASARPIWRSFTCTPTGSVDRQLGDGALRLILDAPWLWRLPPRTATAAGSILGGQGSLAEAVA